MAGSILDIFRSPSIHQLDIHHLRKRRRTVVEQANPKAINRRHGRRTEKERKWSEQQDYIILVILVYVYVSKLFPMFFDAKSSKVIILHKIACSNFLNQKSDYYYHRVCTAITVTRVTMTDLFCFRENNYLLRIVCVWLLVCHLDVIWWRKQ